MVECCCSPHLFRDAVRCCILVNGGHAVSQTEGETVSGKSSFLDCNSGGKCLPGQFDGKRLPGAEFCCECHKGKDSQGSYWKREVKRDKLK